MVDKLKWDNYGVSWYFKNEVTKKISNVFLATLRKEKKLIYVEAGKNFIVEQVYLFLFNGELLFSYDRTSGEIKWNDIDNIRKIVVPNIVQASYYQEVQRILILKSTNVGNVILELNSLGKVLYDIDSPSGYKIEYLSEINQMPVAVCEGDEEHIDNFGRGKKNFYINLMTGKLEKGNLAY